MPGDIGNSIAAGESRTRLGRGFAAAMLFPVPHSERREVPPSRYNARDRGSTGMPPISSVLQVRAQILPFPYFVICLRSFGRNCCVHFTSMGLNRFPSM